MNFGTIPLDDAEGAILAHSVQAGGRKIKKGTDLDAETIGRLRAAGIAEVVAACPEPGEVREDAAAARLAAALAPPGTGIEAAAPFTGRANLVATGPGVLCLDAAAIHALNAVDPGITLATLPDKARVAEGTMVGTVKIIPYAVPGAALEAAVAALGTGSMRVAPPVIDRAELILTRTPGFAEKLLRKGEAVIRERLAALGVELVGTVTVAHETGPIAEAVARASAPLVLILGASATSDADDVCPAGMVQAGGRLIRFGMPVDPGNLLFLGALGRTQVVGLPGCARSPALNGADWVLERLVCGLEVTGEDIGRMGVGGLLKEIPTRPQPRAVAPVAEDAEPRVGIVLLAAGAARRMGGTDKLLEPVGGVPLLVRAARAALASRAGAAVAVLPPDRPARAEALAATAIPVTVAEDAREGMAESLKAGLAALPDDLDAVIVQLADMPDIDAADLDRLIAAYDPAHGREIARAVAEDGRPGHPVLFGRRFFGRLAQLAGDIGARGILAEGAEYLIDVPTRGTGAVTDLDTPEDWARYRSRETG